MSENQAKLSTQPYKGARDFYPADMQIENYIFNTWKLACQSFGFQEYNFPILEPYEIFASKTGEEIVNTQLFSFEDRGGRKIAIRPELTPGTVRMIAQKYQEIPQPIKWFMIGNNWRYEKPQLGRGREFYQLEANIFGVKSVSADFEILNLIVAIMKAFSANETMYEINISDRRLVECLLIDALGMTPELADKTRKLMDKRKKVSQEDFLEMLQDAQIPKEAALKIEAFMSAELEALPNVISPALLEKNLGYQNILKLFKMLQKADLTKFCKFDPSIIRGFDYSDGLVYEVFDKNPVNKRSMFGGERFDRLINIFGNFDLAATGFAMGDYTLKEFLTGWKLLPNFESSCQFFVTLWQEDPNQIFGQIAFEISNKLRKAGYTAFTWLEPNTKLDKQLKYADKMQAKYAIIVGENEAAKNQITIKNLQLQNQQTVSTETFLDVLKDLEAPAHADKPL